MLPTARTILAEISFTTPLGPSVNEAYPTVLKTNKQTGKVYAKRVSSEALENFKEQVWAVLAEHNLIGAWSGAQAVGYTISIYVRRSNADASNYLKAYEDACTTQLGFDDQFIVSGSFSKFVDAKVPRIEGTWYLYR
jgi:Holliday junction resolvase RusA-like endonuclease